MAYIQTGQHAPGIIELLQYKPSSGQALSALAQTLLLGSSGLSSGERELIAAYVSRLNECTFCCQSHAAAARVHLHENTDLVDEVLLHAETRGLSKKMQCLLQLAAKIQKGGKSVQASDIEHARQAGASDEDIHDTVLIAAAFCMFNRYVDGLGTSPAPAEAYPAMGQKMSEGYV
ncbi:MAG: peroxidase-related enzyme [Bacteroidia bacterium]|nr:peroxidase-related enzyme [Bacteroidia bacterium]